jgi:hypothetical protein
MRFANYLGESIGKTAQATDAFSPKSQWLQFWLHSSKSKADHF